MVGGPQKGSLMNGMPVVCAVFCLFSGATLFAAEKTWTGGAGDSLFSSAGNWSPSGAPDDGDALRFSNSSAVSAVNDLVGYSFSGITAAGSATVTFQNTGNGFTLTGDIAITGSKELNLYVPVTLDANVTFNVTNAGLYAYGPITGAGGITVVGGKDFYAKDAVALTNGVTVNDGRLRVEKASFTAPVTLNQFYISASRYVQLIFQASGTYNIPVTIANSQGNGSTLHAPAGVYVTNTAQVVLGPNAYSRWTPDGSITHSGGIVVQTPARSDMAVIFNGNNVISGVPIAFINNLFVDSGTLRLAVASNTYASLKCYTHTVFTDVPDALDPQKVVGFGTSYKKYGTLDIKGNNQTINRPNLDTTALLETSDYNLTSSSGPATLTCRATANSTFFGRLNGALSLSWEPTGNYALTVTGRISQTTGTLQVKAGTLRLAAESAFPTLSALAASGTGVISMEGASVSADISLTLADTAQLALPGTSLTCFDAQVDGNALTAGVYTASDTVGGRTFITGSGTLTVQTIPLSGTVRTWTGGGADENFSTVENWDAAPRFDGSETFLFDSAGTQAVVNGAYELGAIRFNRSAAFKILPSDGTAKLRLGLGGVTALAPVPGTLVTNTLAVPLDLVYACEAQVASNQTLAVSASVSGGLPNEPLVKTGDGTLWLTGTNTFENPLIISNGYMVVNNGTALGNPSNTITICRPTATSPNSWLNRGPIYFTDTVATNDRPIIIESAVSYIGQIYPQNATLVLNGKFTFSAGGRIDNQGRLIFRGGFDSRNNTPWMQTSAGYVTRFEEQPLYFAGNSISLDNFGSFNVCTTNNTWASVGLFKGTFLCGAENCLPTNSYVTFGVGYAAQGFLDLNGFDQQVKFMNYTAGTGSTNMPVKSTQPATLTLQGDSSVRPFIGYFSGAASLRHRNTGTLAFTSSSSASTTTGDLLIEAGSVVFTNGASWTGSTNITVTAGTLAVAGGAGATFGGGSTSVNKTRLHLTSASTVYLADGVTEYVYAATLDGVHLPVGSYGSVSSSAQYKSARFTGTGILYVLRSEIAGTLITVR